MTVQTDGGNSIKKLPTKLGAKDRIYFNQTFALDVQQKIYACPSREGFHVFDLKNNTCVKNFSHLKYKTLLDTTDELQAEDEE